MNNPIPMYPIGKALSLPDNEVVRSQASSTGFGRTTLTLASLELDHADLKFFYEDLPPEETIGVITVGVNWSFEHDTWVYTVARLSDVTDVRSFYLTEVPYISMTVVQELLGPPIKREWTFDVEVTLTAEITLESESVKIAREEVNDCFQDHSNLEEAFERLFLDKDIAPNSFALSNYEIIKVE